MHAQPGDWLVMHSHTDAGQVRKAEIISTHDGAPPFTVRWIDDDHVSLVFPGPDAEVLSVADLAAREQSKSS